MKNKLDAALNLALSLADLDEKFNVTVRNKENRITTMNLNKDEILNLQGFDYIRQICLAQKMKAL